MGIPFLHRNIAGRFTRFGLVGASGVLVNELATAIGLLMFRDALSIVIRTNLAVFLGWLISVLTNFTLNYHWTWRDRKGQRLTPVYQKLVRYYASATAAWIVQASVVNLMAATLGWNVIRILLFNLVGILLGMFVNFVLVDKWVFK